MALLAEYTTIRANGGKTPQIVFLCPFGDPTAVVQQLYTDLYGAGLYSDLWFRWDNNKPLIMADPAYFSGNPTLAISSLSVNRSQAISAADRTSGAGSAYIRSHPSTITNRLRSALGKMQSKRSWLDEPAWRARQKLS